MHDLARAVLELAAIVDASGVIDDRGVRWHAARTEKRHAEVATFMDAEAVIAYALAVGAEWNAPLPEMTRHLDGLVAQLRRSIAKGREHHAVMVEETTKAKPAGALSLVKDDRGQTE
ncbi:MAG: hypothetical protein ACJ768_12780 [Gaiellaceae bacterium]